MLVETVKLSTIVMKLTPELYPFLKQRELESEIVLRNGLAALEAEDAMEIIQYSISEHQKDAHLH
ncbi:hypothetical protein P9314_17580 [Paenibacillus validus]|mgnify:FL=1|uniref:Uncharacterized protein n=1 Tax=Paenibacillus validus TaxID=44253 RepID=A0A7X2ZAU4_9BACL|nr:MULTISPECIES: hypothetical protein [Paenibacillus]MED4602481.1 hypothetical protein [Paenibacillus validus]MED4608361.1 hypothetical protein [Paenibacillus validus]MUG71421.1 hypothetical protein [Paenibacillus validus]